MRRMRRIPGNISIKRKLPCSKYGDKKYGDKKWLGEGEWLGVGAGSAGKAAARPLLFSGTPAPYTQTSFHPYFFAGLETGRGSDEVLMK